MEYTSRPSRDDQPGLRALSLDQGVDRGGRAVDQLADPGDIDCAHAQTIDDPLDELGWRGEALGLCETTGGFIESHQVGECASDIDRHQQQIRPSQ